jgi:glutamate formiminotransferase
VLECVVNVSEGRDRRSIETIARAAGRALLDVHHDADHHRSVLTLAGPDCEGAARAVTAAAVLALDLRRHRGAHPRFGVVDVVPFVPLEGADLGEAMAARDRFGAWAGHELGVPCFRYGPECSLPEVRRRAFTDLAPDDGPPRPHPTAGAIAVGARPVLVAYNVWLAEPDLAEARDLARRLRSPAVRALGLPVGDRVQVSMNLVDPSTVGPAEVVDAIAARAEVAGTELVGLVPANVLRATPGYRWAELDLAPDRTIEARLSARGWRSG